jgi:hypothetical protein
MFKLQPNPTFKSSVLIPIPGGKDGKITVIFKHKGRKALQEFFASLTDEKNTRTDVEALAELIADWEGVDVKYSEEALEQLLDAYPSAAMAMFDAYRAAVLDARVKN